MCELWVVWTVKGMQDASDSLRWGQSVNVHSQSVTVCQYTSNSVCQCTLTLTHTHNQLPCDNTHSHSVSECQWYVNKHKSPTLAYLQTAVWSRLMTDLTRSLIVSSHGQHTSNVQLYSNQNNIILSLSYFPTNCRTLGISNDISDSQDWFLPHDAYVSCSICCSAVFVCLSTGVLCRNNRALHQAISTGCRLVA